MVKTKGTAVYECLTCGFVFIGDIDNGDADIAYDASEGQNGRALKIEYRCHICNKEGQVGIGKLKMFYTDESGEKFFSDEDYHFNEDEHYIPLPERNMLTKET